MAGGSVLCAALLCSGPGRTQFERRCQLAYFQMAFVARSSSPLPPPYVCLLMMGKEMISSLWLREGGGGAGVEN